MPRMAEEDSPEDRASGVSDEEEFPSEEVGKGMSADGGAAGTERFRGSAGAFSG